MSVNRCRRNAKIPHRFRENWKKSKFPPYYFGVTKISHLPNFDMISLAVRTVDGESLSEITIHNFEKNRKIENRILPYGRQCVIYLL